MWGITRPTRWEAPVEQTFTSDENIKLASLPTHVCDETGRHHVLWSDVRHAFPGIDHLQDYEKARVLFEMHTEYHDL